MAEWTANWPVVAGSDYSADVYLDNVDEAWHKRRYVTAGIATSPGNFHTAGDNLQSVLSVRRIQEYIEGATVSPRWVDPDAVFDQVGASEDESDWYVHSLAEFRTLAGINAAGFRRDYPRLITNTASTTDQDGNAAANGQKALAGDGRIYERVAGAWVDRGPPGAHHPDTLTSYGSNSILSPLGAAIIGDYITETGYVFNELKACFEKMVAQVHSEASSPAPLTYAVNSRNYRCVTEGGTYPNSWAASQALSAAAYASGVSDIEPRSNAPEAYTAGVYEWEPSDPSDTNQWQYRSTISCSRVKYQVTGTSTIAYSVEFYAYTNDPISIDAGGAFTEPPDQIDEVWDNNTFAAPQNDWKLYETVGPSTANKVTGWIGLDPSTYTPVWCAEPTQEDTSGRDIDARGFTGGNTNGVGHIAAIVRWSF